MTLAATLCNARISTGISDGEAGALMHGPTFMGNPLACATAIASIQLLLSQPWQRTVERLHAELAAGLAPARDLANVADVRTLGAIGVIELREALDMSVVQAMFVERGVWVRPFGKLVYAMPPYTMGTDDVNTLTQAMVEVVEAIA
jgi:adenosylmethionine-8-amino-7-oxononanoate aminotransferase